MHANFSFSKFWATGGQRTRNGADERAAKIAFTKPKSTFRTSAGAEGIERPNWVGVNAATRRAKSRLLA
jgi:hypothetical protein